MLIEWTITGQAAGIVVNSGGKCCLYVKTSPTRHAVVAYLGLRYSDPDQRTAASALVSAFSSAVASNRTVTLKASADDGWAAWPFLNLQLPSTHELGPLPDDDPAIFGPPG